MVKTYVGLLRAVNVGGTGKLEMPALRRLAESCGFARARTYIASGNLLFDSELGEAEVKAALEAALLAHAGKAVGAMIRTAEQMQAVLDANPFPQKAPNRTVAIFLDAAPAEDLLAGVSGRADEEIAAGVREIYVHYGEGMGASRLRLPAARAGTARNMNTVARLADLAAR